MSAPLRSQTRLDLLFDAGSFCPIQPQRLGGSGLADGDGVVVGWGQIGGRLVAAYAQEPTYQGGSLGHRAAERIVRLQQMSRERRLPLIALNDGAGARIAEGLDALDGYGQIGRQIVLSSGLVPQLSVILGACAGGAAYGAVMSDFVLMTRDASMFVTGPDVLRRVTGENLTKEELGGTQIHAEVNGVCHAVADSDEEVLALARRLLDYLPDSFEQPRARRTTDDPERDSLIEPLIPQDSRKIFDVKTVIAELFDHDSFLEIHERFARNLVVGFARLDGHSVGVVANQPRVSGGILDTPASRKASRFINTCSAFGLPVLMLADTPGFVSGATHERNGILISGAQFLYAFGGCRSVKIGVCLRKSYGGAFVAMGARSLGADFYFSLPNSELAVMGAHAAHVILRKKNEQESEDEFVARYRRDVSNPERAAAAGHVDHIVAPAALRRTLIRCLDVAGRGREAPSRPIPNLPL